MRQVRCWAKTDMYKVPHSYLHKFSLCPSLTGLYHLSRYSACSKKCLRTPPPSLCTSYFTGNFNCASKNNRPWLLMVTENQIKGIESGITYFSAKRLYICGLWCTYTTKWAQWLCSTAKWLCRGVSYSYPRILVESPQISGLNEDSTRTRPGLDQDWTRTGPGLDQDWMWTGCGVTSQVDNFPVHL